MHLWCVWEIQINKASWFDSKFYVCKLFPKRHFEFDIFLEDVQNIFIHNFSNRRFAWRNNLKVKQRSYNRFIFLHSCICVVYHFWFLLHIIFIFINTKTKFISTKSFQQILNVCMIFFFLISKKNISKLKFNHWNKLLRSPANVATNHFSFLSLPSETPRKILNPSFTIFHNELLFVWHKYFLQPN